MSEITDTKPVTVQIRNNETGEIRIHKDEVYCFDGNSEPSVYNWEEGNYSCDCNRELFFIRAVNEGFPSEPDYETYCSDGRFSVRLILEDGQVIYEEFTEDQGNETVELKD